MTIKFRKFLISVCAVILTMTALHLLFAFLPYSELDSFLRKEYSTRVYDRKNNLVQITPLNNGLRREYLASAEIPGKVKKAFIKAEDRRFYFHYGVDFFSIFRAFVQNTANKKNVSGASTITMQLAKIISLNYNNQDNLYRQGSSRTIKDKISEAFCAIKLEARFSKKEILELYLNSIPFGNNVEGIQSASRLYFSKGTEELTDEEIEQLAKIPRRPNLYSPGKKYAYPFYMPHLVRYLRENNYFLTEKEIKTRTYKSSVPFEVHLSADMNVQDYAQQCADSAIQNAKDSRISNISVLAMDVQTGRVLAWVGSNDFMDDEHSGQIDGVRFKNQPGSSIKPLLYALALDEGIVKPTDILPDVPMEFGTDKAYIPFNFNNRFNGPISLRVCLASSLNIPAVYILNIIGVDKFIEKLKELNFTDIEKIGREADLGLALGGGEVSLKDFLPAFSVFARDGKYIPLEYLSEKYHPKKAAVPVQVYSVDSSRIIANFLSEKNGRSLGFGHYQTFETQYPSIFKTGTSNQFQNITALGATPRYAVAVWMGNFSGETVVGKTGSSLPASVAKKVLDYLESYDEKESLQFEEPENYEKIEVCQLSGEIPNKDCISTVYEYVKKDEVLSQCTWHKENNGKVVIYYPQEYQYWYSMNQSLYSSESVRINYSETPLKIIYPRNDSLFYIEESKIKRQQLNIEVIGGLVDEIEIYVDDQFYAKKERPFIQSIPLEKGKHKCKVICGNQENIVFYEVR